MRKLKIPDLELKILQVLWRLDNRAGVQDIIDGWRSTPAPGYTTILKKLQIMETKDIVTHEKVGRAFEYSSTITKEEVSKRSIHDMLSELFLGNKLDMAGAFFADADLSREELNEIKKLIEERRAIDE